MYGVKRLITEEIRYHHSNQKNVISIVTAELQWLEHLWNHENIFETGEVRVNEC